MYNMGRFLPAIIFFSFFHLAKWKTFAFQPHIIFMVADDYGWNDIGFHNPDIHTPNLDQLAKSGIILNSTYVLPLCTPSRTAFMTGYFPYRTGMQNFVIPTFGPFGIPLQFQLMPQALKALGYSTNMVGKWHLGACNDSYLPTNRGFDTFLGYLGGGEYHYTHNYPLSDDTMATSGPGVQEVYDFWNQTNVAWNYNGTYSSVPFTAQVQHILENRPKNAPLFMYLPFQLTHSPLEVSEDYLFWYPNQTNTARKLFSAMATHLDNDVGQIVNMLKLYGIYNQSIIVFTADNGGDVKGGANNYPLRGSKGTLFEGGTRAAAFVHSPLLKKTGYTYNGLTHAVDWFPTFVSLAGGTPDPNLDGVDVWSAITENSPSPRKAFVYNFYYTGSNFSGAIRVGDWKLIAGNANLPDTQVTPEQVTGVLTNVPGGEALPEINFPPYRLYNIKNDPTESNDLAASNPTVLNRLKKRLRQYKQKMVQTVFRAGDISLYQSLTQNITYLNTNWCEAILQTVLMN